MLTSGNIRTRKKRLTFFVGGVLLILLFGWILSRFSFFSSTQFIGRPFWSLGGYVSNVWSEVTISFADKSRLQELNVALQNENAEANLALLKNSILEEENLYLKEALNRAQGRDLLLASVLSRPPKTFYDVLIIDVGEKDGVRSGDQVYSKGDTLVGSVEEVSASTSKVKLLSSSGTEFEATIGTHMVTANIVGVGGGNFRAELPREAGVTTGDAVYISGVHTSIVGVVGHIEDDPAKLFQTVFIESPVNVWGLSWVEVGRDGN